jgi:hypothetical protein
MNDTKSLAHSTWECNIMWCGYQKVERNSYMEEWQNTWGVEGQCKEPCETDGVV